MKIAYLAEFSYFSNDGVCKKIEQQTKNWKELGHSVKGFYISHDKGKSNGTENNVYTSFFIKEDTNFINKQLNRMYSILKLFKDLKKYNPDIIYYRQNAWFPGLIKTLKLAPVIMEINSNDISEMNLMNPIKKYLYLFGRKKILRNVNAILSVSNEIILPYEKYNIPIKVIGNGFQFERKIQKNTKQLDLINIIFVGTPNLAWHGVDKFIKLAELLPQFQFHLVGPKTEEKFDNLTSHGWLNKKELNSLYAKMNLAVSTLSLYKNNMQEASPLKSREYAYYDLPMIVGYIDTDLEGEDYILNIGNYENSIIDNITMIKEFINEWAYKSIPYEDVKNKLDYKIKEKKRIDFFKEIMNKSHEKI